jgi:hypothetical protein
MYPLSTHAVPSHVYEYEWMVLTRLRRWKEWRKKVGEGAITCKAYSADSSEAMGQKDGSIWSCVRGAYEYRRRYLDEIQLILIKWKARGLPSARGSAIII